MSYPKVQHISVQPPDGISTIAFRRFVKFCLPPFILLRIQYLFNSRLQVRFGVGLLVYIAVTLLVRREAYSQDAVRIVVAQFDPSLELTIEECLTHTFEDKRVELMLYEGDTLNHLERFVENEFPIFETDCFYPNLKIVYPHYTYLLSSYCGKILKFRNTAPHTPGRQSLALDFIFTQSLLDYLERFQHRFFRQDHEFFYSQLREERPSAEEVYSEIYLESHDQTGDENASGDSASTTSPVGAQVQANAASGGGFIRFDYQDVMNTDGPVEQKIDKLTEEVVEEDKLRFDFEDDFGSKESRPNRSNKGCFLRRWFHAIFSRSSSDDKS